MLRHDTGQHIRLINQWKVSEIWSSINGYFYNVQDSLVNFILCGDLILSHWCESRRLYPRNAQSLVQHKKILVHWPHLHVQLLMNWLAFFNSKWLTSNIWCLLFRGGKWSRCYSVLTREANGVDIFHESLDVNG